jgi:predicted phage baseplate assembly protein
MAGCPTDVDCLPVPCPPEESVEPLLDYMAKDYASFRRLLIDLLPTLNPDWVERNPSDLAIALLELLAYEGDRLSYYQDAVANEAYLDTLRTRISARRHANLVDYRMHDGRNAWAPVVFAVSVPNVTLPRGTALFTKLTAPLRGQTAPPGFEIAPNAITVDGLQRDPELQGVAAFETAYEQQLHIENNTIRLHPWGEEQCCLAPGTTEAYLYHVPDGPAPQTAVLPVLNDGDYLVLEEVMGPRTGAPADADPRHRQLVRIDGTPEPGTDPLYSDQVSDDLPAIAQQGDTALPLLHVR